MSGPQANHEIDPLTRLAIKHGTDKWGPHFYTPVYHRLFAALRDRPIRLLEIGVGGFELMTAGGASLAMWADYFSSGQITGIDIAEKRLAPHPRIKLFRGSQDDAGFLKTVSDARGPFDIIIDDGSHIPKQVVASFHALLPALADGGIYVIEDVQTTFWPRFGGSTMRGGDTLKLAHTVLECLNHAEIAVGGASHALPSFAKQIKMFRAFHNLLVIDKGDNSEPSNFAYDLDNPAVVGAAKTIEQALQSAPNAEGMANLADMYRLGGDTKKAMQIAEQALSQWPQNPTALLAAYNVANQAKDTPKIIHYLERILQLEPDNLQVQRTLQHAHTQLKQ
jgi:tetratricopeptide (TPR) repeat protein